MKKARMLHHEAMELVESAQMSRIRGEESAGISKKLRRAFELERQAAGLAADDLSLEPTRSVLHRGAATLALRCGELREAERLIAVGLAGNPPDEIAEELRDLLEQVNFDRHLRLRKISLAPTEIQMSLSGPGVSFGVVQNEQFVGRVQATEKLVYRTAERRMGVSYRDRGNPDKDIRDRFSLFLAVPEAASFAVTMKFGTLQEREQPRLPLSIGVDPDQVIDEIMRCLDDLNQGNLDTVRQQIPDDAYFTNFVQLARRIAPDGQEIRQVGFTVVRNGQQRRLSLTSPSVELRPVRVASEAPKSPEPEGRLEGMLLSADATSQEKGEITVRDRDGNDHTVIVPRGMMSDIVRPYFEQDVVVEGSRTAKGILLENITPANA